MTKSYITQGPNGIEEVRCLRCGTPVRILATGIVTSRDGRKFNVSRLMDLPIYRTGKKIKIITPRGPSSINPIICSDCEGKDIDPEVVLNLYREQWLEHAKSEEEKEYMSAIKLAEGVQQ